MPVIKTSKDCSGWNTAKLELQLAQLKIAQSINRQQVTSEQMGPVLKPGPCPTCGQSESPVHPCSRETLLSYIYHNSQWHTGRNISPWTWGQQGTHTSCVTQVSITLTTSHMRDSGYLLSKVQGTGLRSRRNVSLGCTQRDTRFTKKTPHYVI